MPRRSLAEYLELFRRHGSQTAFVCPRGYRSARWTYRQVAETAARVARELEARNIAKGDRVLLWGENSPEWVAAFFGCLLRGAVVVPMDRIAAPDFARRVGAQVDARLLMGSRELLQAVPVPGLAFEALAEAVARHSRSPYTGPALDRDDPVQIVFTSGTTAEPKGVVISHGNVLANLEPLETEIARYLKYERIFHPIRFLNLLPLSHVFGQFLGMFVPPLMAGTVHFQESLNPSEIIRTIQRERISVLVAVPRILESLKDKIERDMEAVGRLGEFHKDLERFAQKKFMRRWWRFRRIHSLFGWKFWAFVSGGAALDAQTEEFWRRLSFVVVQGYGLTETTSLISVNHPFRLGRGSIGKVLPGRELKLDSTGEILVRGDNVASAYWQGRELKKVEGEEGWFRTGDIGALDDEGNLYFKGRKKDVIVTPEGMNVYPEDLEAALRRQPEVRDCAVVGLEREGNAVPCAVLILRDTAADAEAIVQRANDSLAEFQHMRHWLVWPQEDFPRTSTQKPRTNVIAQVVRAQLGQTAGGAVAASPLAELVARITRRSGDLSPDASLERDLNLSSTERVELLSALEDRFQVDLNESRFTAATTLGDLEKMLHEPAAARSDFTYPRWAQRWPITWIRPAVYYLLTWPATMLMAAPFVRGRQNLAGVTGPLLVVCNHITHTDVGFVIAALPFHLRHRLAVAMEGERLEGIRRPPPEMNPFLRVVSRVVWALICGLFNVFPLPQRAGFRRSFAYAGESVDRGLSVLVFPEGARTRDGKIARFRTGIGLLANNLGLPVLPMRIDGLWEMKQTDRRFVAPGFVKVSIGKPVRFAPGTPPEQIAAELQQLVASL